MSLRLRRRRRDEMGAVAILVAVLALVICMFAAYAVDIGVQVNRKHMLNDTLDAAAQAGAYELPGSSTTAATQALAFAKAHDPSEDGLLKPSVDFWCVVASKLVSGSYAVDTSQIPATCNPGAAPYIPGANYLTTARKISCSQILCAIPCVEPVPNNGSPKIACNTIRVYQGRDVPFAFAPAGGIAKGGTGNLVSVACKGSCGTIAPNPMDVAVVADRTGSMSANIDDLQVGIQGMLKVMSPEQQYVALGTIGKGTPSTTPTSDPTGSSCYSAAGSGTWVPLPFSKSYLNAAGTDVNTSSALVKALNCLSTSSSGTALASPMKAAARYLVGNAPNNLSSLPVRQDPPTKVLIFETDGQPNEPDSGGTGSASLGDPNDLYSGPAHTTSSPQVSVGPVTSGPTTPYPTQARSTGSGANKKNWTDTYKTTYKTTTKTTTTTIDGGQTACSNLGAVATNAKAANILVITIAYNLGGNTCGQDNDGRSDTSNTVDATPVIDSITPAAAETTSGGKKVLLTTYAGNATINQTVTRTITKVNYVNAPDALVTTTLAAAASPSKGQPSVANNSCKTTAEQTVENGDGDYFFCAVQGADLAPIFKTALSQVSKGIKLIRMP